MSVLDFQTRGTDCAGENALTGWLDVLPHAMATWCGPAAWRLDDRVHMHMAVDRWRCACGGAGE